MRARGVRANSRPIRVGSVQYPVWESKSSSCVAVISNRRVMRDLRGNEMLRLSSLRVRGPREYERATR